MTLFAGLSTGLGSLVAFFSKRSNYRLLGISTGFSAGVMLYISFVELFPDGGRILADIYGKRNGSWFNLIAFFSGIALIALIDMFIPSDENPHERPSKKRSEPLKHSDTMVIHNKGKLLRMGLLTALAVTIHNFPEGLASFAASLHDNSLGFAVAFAVALHNIPEGISVAVPIYYATGRHSRAVLYSLLSGLAEPLGAAIAYVVLVLCLGGATDIPKQILGFAFAGIAGIMVYISLDELIPASHAYGKGHDSIIGMAMGMAVMAASILLMA